MKRTDKTIHQVLENSEIANTPGLNSDTIRKWGNDNKNVREHYESYFHKIKNQGSCGPIEKHPYIEKYIQDFDLSRKILLLGTFPPNSYMNNLELSNLPNPNVESHKPIDFFYGNMTDLWYYLFDIDSEIITVAKIREKLRASEMSITDVFAYVQRRKMKSANDTYYKNIVLNKKLTGLFNSSSKVETIMTTSGMLTHLLNMNTPNTITGFCWVLEQEFKDLSQFKISGSTDGNGEYFDFGKDGIEHALKQQNNGIIWWLKKGNQKIRIVNLPSPSPQSSRSIPRMNFYKKWVNYKAKENNIPLPTVTEAKGLTKQYFSKHPGVFSSTPTKQYRKDVYAKVLDNTIQEI